MLPNNWKDADARLGAGFSSGRRLGSRALKTFPGWRLPDIHYHVYGRVFVDGGPQVTGTGNHDALQTLTVSQNSPAGRPSRGGDLGLGQQVLTPSHVTICLCT